MAVDMFLDITGEIDGESVDSVHAGTIDVLAWAWGLSQPGTFHDGAQGAGIGKANFQDMQVTTWLDASTATFMHFAASGDHFPDAMLICRKAAGENPLEFLKIKMTKVLITSCSTGGSGGEARMTQNVTLNFAEVTVDYTPQNDDGSAGADVHFGRDIASNVAI